MVLLISYLGLTDGSIVSPMHDYQQMRSEGRARTSSNFASVAPDFNIMPACDER
jgi:hypothetical protein